jgi:hypothetical protein
MKKKKVYTPYRNKTQRIIVSSIAIILVAAMVATMIISAFV